VRWWIVPGRTIGEAFVKVRPNTDGFEQEAGSRIGGALKKVAATAAAVLASAKIKDFFVDAVRGASDLNETASKTQVVFGAATAKVTAFAEQAATKMGQSKQAVLDGASTFAIYGKTAGVSGAKLADFSTQLVSLAGDMASFSNTSPEEAIQAIGAAMRGESDPIEKYGVLLNESILKQVAFKAHIIKTTKEALTPQQRVLAVQAALFQQLGAKGSGTLGDFERTSAGLANQQRILSANWQNLTATVGTSLLPVLTKLTTELNTKLMPALFDLWSQHGAQVTAWLERNASKIGPGIGKLVDKISSVDWPGVIKRAHEELAKLSPEMAKIGGGVGEGFHNTMSVGATVMGFLADHTDLLAKALPALAIGFVLVKTAQASETLVAAARIPLSVAEMVMKQRTNAAIRAHTAALLANTAAQRGSTVAQIADNAATNTGILAKGRAVIANMAMRVAELAKAVATGIATAAQIALDIAMAPVTLVILAIVLAIGLLVGGIMLLWKHNEGFRNFVIGAWDAIKKAFTATVSWITDTAWPAIKRFFTGLANGAKSVWESISNYFSRVVAFVTGVKDKIASVASGMWDGIKDAFKSAVNFIIRGWNNIHLSLPAVDMGPLGRFGGFTLRVPQLPLLARGGVIDPRPGGTAAILAEAGEREIATPESLMRRMIAEAVTAGRSDVNVNIIADHPAIAAFVKFLTVVVDDRLGKTAAAVAGGHRL
jgi:hypothetical protein